MLRARLFPRTLLILLLGLVALFFVPLLPSLLTHWLEDLSTDHAAEAAPLALYRSAEGELWTADPAQPDSARRWTQTDGRVAARQPLAFGGEAVFAVQNDAGGADLWQIGRGEDTARLLLKCAADECAPLAWSPRGDALLYLRAVPGAADGEAYLLDISSGQSTALFANGERVGYGAAWSPDGGWLALRDEHQAGIRVLALNGEAAFFVPSAGGGAGCWAESGGRLYLYFDDLVRGASSFRGVIRRLEMPGGAAETVAGGAMDRIGFSYKSPVCRPFAEGAFAAAAQPDPRVPGAQLWLMDAEGRRQAVILEGFDLVPGGLAWRPDGGALLYHVFALPGGAAQGEVRIWNLNGAGGTLRLAGTAAFPAWLP